MSIYYIVVATLLGTPQQSYAMQSKTSLKGYNVQLLNGDDVGEVLIQLQYMTIIKITVFPQIVTTAFTYLSCRRYQALLIFEAGLYINTNVVLP